MEYSNKMMSHEILSSRRLVKVNCVIGKNGTMPIRGSAGSAGVDLCSAVECVVAPGEQTKISTQLYCEIPDGYVGKIEPRSGLAAKHCIRLNAGVIDSDYRGEISILLKNEGSQPFHIQVGDRIAQLIIYEHAFPMFVECPQLSETQRGAGGFGSTGITSEIFRLMDDMVKECDQDQGICKKQRLAE